MSKITETVKVVGAKAEEMGEKAKADLISTGYKMTHPFNREAKEDAEEARLQRKTDAAATRQEKVGKAHAEAAEARGQPNSSTLTTAGYEGMAGQPHSGGDARGEGRSSETGTMGYGSSGRGGGHYAAGTGAGGYGKTGTLGEGYGSTSGTQGTSSYGVPVTREYGGGTGYIGYGGSSGVPLEECYHGSSAGGAGYAEGGVHGIHATEGAAYSGYGTKDPREPDELMRGPKERGPV